MRFAKKMMTGAAAILLVSNGVPAQQGTGGGGSANTPTIQVYSRLAVVDVTVTDDQGQPVQGLKQSDFTLLEDGKPQPIRNFQEVTAGSVPPLPQLPDHVYTNLQPPAPTSAVNIILMDFANEAPKDSTNFNQIRQSTAMQHYVKDAALRALDQMPTGTRVAILAMTNSLHIMQSFTSNVELLKAAISAAPYDLEGHGDIQCVQSNERNEMVLETFDQIAADVAGMKVRKNLYWFTVGIPAITDPNMRPKCLPDYSKGLEHAFGLLNDAQVAVYPIDARGLSSLVDQSGALLSMDTVAQATGGVAFYANNNITQELLQALADGANYYSMAYVPPNAKFDGNYHKIDVKVDWPGVHLVFRKGYFADDLSKITLKPGLTMSLTPPPAYAGNMKAPMSRGMATSEELLFDVQVEPSTVPRKPGDPPVMGTLDAKLQGKRLVRYGFQYDVPAKQLAFTNGPKGTHAGLLDFDIAVFDANDKLLTGLSQSLKMALTEDTYQQTLKGPVRFFQQIDLPATGPLFIRVGVLDHTSGKVGTLELPLTTGKGQKKDAAQPANPGD